jgi:hypothetical protein
MTGEYGQIYYTEPKGCANSGTKLIWMEYNAVQDLCSIE